MCILQTLFLNVFLISECFQIVDSSCLNTSVFELTDADFNSSTSAYLADTLSKQWASFFTLNVSQLLNASAGSQVVNYTITGIQEAGATCASSSTSYARASSTATASIPIQSSSMSIFSLLSTSPSSFVTQSAVEASSEAPVMSSIEQFTTQSSAFPSSTTTTISSTTVAGTTTANLSPISTPGPSSQTPEMSSIEQLTTQTSALPSSAMTSTISTGKSTSTLSSSLPVPTSESGAATATANLPVTQSTTVATLASTPVSTTHAGSIATRASTRITSLTSSTTTAGATCASLGTRACGPGAVCVSSSSLYYCACSTGRFGNAYDTFTGCIAEV